MSQCKGTRGDVGPLLNLWGWVAGGGGESGAKGEKRAKDR